MSKHWNPEDYTLVNQLSDIINGKDVVTSDDGTVMKGTENHVSVFWTSSSSKGHGHAGFDYDDDGNLTGYDIYNS